MLKEINIDTKDINFSLLIDQNYDGLKTIQFIKNNLNNILELLNILDNKISFNQLAKFKTYIQTFNGII
ncbi:hypothetical protein [Mycoplasma sp. SG1]|uniref:hypothetical protein n=1 Tax=Mycoplasma sp. SG1 TaxID=2810348 RepID=UPI0020252694|nr:hypothetical protein [Mycoplasma sp. SG1]URM53150.1 hypothetical protein JRW51_02265 [Mycoplasma sp. SG1]